MGKQNWVFGPRYFKEDISMLCAMDDRKVLVFKSEDYCFDIIEPEQEEVQWEITFIAKDIYVEYKKLTRK